MEKVRKNLHCCDKCPSYWLRIIGWMEMFTYPIVALISLISITFAMVIEMRGGRVEEIAFDRFSILLTLSDWLPWYIVTLPSFLLQLIFHCFVKLFPNIRRTMILVVGSRFARGQSIVWFLISFIILVVGTFMAWLLLLGIKSKNYFKIKVWTIYVGFLMLLNVAELVTELFGAWGPTGTHIIVHSIISFIVQGTIFGAALSLMSDLRKAKHGHGREFKRIEGQDESNLNQSAMEDEEEE